MAIAVIGANFGDEGKGVITDYLVAKHNSNLVVRFNGGAQASHTVTISDGNKQMRHAFSHFGSGTFHGAATLLSRFFILNPILFEKEWNELQLKGVTPEVKIDLDAIVTTPYDMFFNQALESARGAKKHGSCGLGIAETVERSDKFCVIKAMDLENIRLVRAKIEAIRTTWFEFRKKELALDTRDIDAYFVSDEVVDRFIKCVEFMNERVSYVNDSYQIRIAHNPIFEGAQGLQLDQDYGILPHVTRSNTGLKNVVELLNGRVLYRGIADELEVVYVTRAYCTRHGAGPLSGEASQEEIGIKVVDQTNIPNPWQDSMRYAPLDTGMMHNAIDFDLSYARDLRVKRRLAITCLDQIYGDQPFKINNYRRPHTLYTDVAQAISNFTQLFEYQTPITCYGPARSDVREEIK